MLYLLLLPVSYIVFVFIAESFNPFQASVAPSKRSRWRLGRAAALVTLLVGLPCLLLMDTMQLDSKMVLAMFLAVSAALMLPPVLKHRRRKVWR